MKSPIIIKISSTEVEYCDISLEILVVVSSVNNHIITISIDGFMKFWRKTYQLIEFVKHFRAHYGIMIYTRYLLYRCDHRI